MRIRGCFAHFDSCLKTGISKSSSWLPGANRKLNLTCSPSFRWVFKPVTIRWFPPGFSSNVPPGGISSLVPIALLLCSPIPKLDKDCIVTIGSPKLPGLSLRTWPSILSSLVMLPRKKYAPKDYSADQTKGSIRLPDNEPAVVIHIEPIHRKGGRIFAQVWHRGEKGAAHRSQRGG
jgi:hypothetical protein